MTDPTAPETPRNEAAERLRRLIDHGEGWPDEYHDLLDAALAEERRLVVKRINAMRYDYRTLPHGQFPVKWPDWKGYEELLPSNCSCQDCRLWRSGS
jgi:hypothetical protein